MTIHLIATGGTISSHHDGEGWTELDGAALVGELAADLDVAGIDVEVADVRSGPSSNLSVDDMLAVAERVRSALAAGADGVVVTHGTDTIELTAFVTELVLGIDPDRPPVVFTGSMRVHSHMAPDGPTNMLDAIRTAAHPAAIGREVMVCLDGTLHAAARCPRSMRGRSTPSHRRRSARSAQCATAYPSSSTGPSRHRGARRWRPSSATSRSSRASRACRPTRCRGC
ncbi:MAG: asparaginase domain-containing protein [Ilumatobacteraceae bacterium]